MKHTKQKILEISLDLFSRKGFSAVSIRDICGQVQIKESTVYYHFRNKQAIFDELLEQFQNKASDMISRLEQALQNDFTPEGNPFYGNVCDTFFESYLMDDFCNKVMRLLSIEQLHSDTVREFYMEHGSAWIGSVRIGSDRVGSENFGSEKLGSVVPCPRWRGSFPAAS